jgi:hypothetical protein
MSTNPEVEVPEQSVTDRLESLFSEEPEAEAPEEDTPEAEAEPEEEATDEPEAAEADDEAEEVEYEGKAYKLPKELKGALLRNQDYTRKTQEVAELRKAAEEKATFLEEVEQLRGKTFERAVKLSAIDAQLEQFNQINWDQLATADQSEYLRLDRMQQRLQRQRDEVHGEIQQAITQERQKTAEARQQMLSKGAAELARDIKGWGPQLSAAIVDNGKAYGFNESELTQITDPRYVKALHDAYQWRKLQASKPEVQKKAASAKPMTVSSRSAPQAQREGISQQARQQLRKSGRAEDAERFFESILTRKR